MEKDQPIQPRNKVEGVCDSRQIGRPNSENGGVQDAKNLRVKDMLDPQFQNCVSSTGSKYPYSLYGGSEGQVSAIASVISILDSHRFEDILDEAIASEELKEKKTYKKWAKKISETKFDDGRNRERHRSEKREVLGISFGLV